MKQLRIINRSCEPVTHATADTIIKTMTHHFNTDEHDPYTCSTCMKSMAMEPGEHPVDAFARMETEFYKFIDLKQFNIRLNHFFGITMFKSFVKDGLPYKPNGEPFTPEELSIINEFIKLELTVKLSELEKFVARSYIIGNILSHAERQAKAIEHTRVIMSTLPKTITDAVQKYQLTVIEAQAMKFSLSNAAAKITNMQDTARRIVVDTILDAQKRRLSGSQLAQALFGKIGDTETDLNRDWRRVAITESNDALQNGFLTACQDGDFVVGVSLPGACQWCVDNIKGKEFRVRSEPPPDYAYLDMKSDQYGDIAASWEFEVWPGKSNYGRSISPNKRTETGLIPREHHEQAMPCCPGHPQCRCYWRRKQI